MTLDQPQSPTRDDSAIIYLRDVSDNALHWTARACLTEALNHISDDDQIIVITRNPRTQVMSLMRSGLRDMETLGILFKAAKDW